MKRQFKILAASLCTTLLFTGCSAPEPQQTAASNEPAAGPWQPIEDTERTNRAQTTYQELFGDMDLSINKTNPEYADIINNFIYGDVYHQSDLLDLRERELITLVSLTTHQSYELLRQHAVGAVNAGLTPEEVMEAVYHCTPYVGIATSYEAVTAVTEAFVENDIPLPLEEQTQVSDLERYSQGNEAQVSIFGEFIRRPEDQVEDGINKYVSAWCFGDFYTRGAIDLKTRELLTMCILANMGVDQLSSHVRGTNSVGYSQEEIIAAITQCMPYMGTPRTLSAMSVVNQAFAPEPAPAPDGENSEE